MTMATPLPLRGNFSASAADRLQGQQQQQRAHWLSFVISSLMQQASFNSEMPRLEQKSSASRHRTPPPPPQSAAIAVRCRRTPLQSAAATPRRCSLPPLQFIAARRRRRHHCRHRRWSATAAVQRRLHQSRSGKGRCTTGRWSVEEDQEDG